MNCYCFSLKLESAIFFFFQILEGPDSKYLRLFQDNVPIKTIETCHFGIKTAWITHKQKDVTLCQ